MKPRKRNKSRHSFVPRLLAGVLLLLVLGSCSVEPGENSASVEQIADAQKQDSIFSQLISLVNDVVPESSRNDSLAFLILPVQASCPSCRTKTIDSILANKDKLGERHFVIISANGGRKTINSFFRERDGELPVLERLILDSTNQAYKFDLYDKKPTMYYTFNKKAYKKVASVPSTVKNDLREFFSGWRDNNSSK